MAIDGFQMDEYAKSSQLLAEQRAEDVFWSLAGDVAIALASLTFKGIEEGKAASINFSSAGAKKIFDKRAGKKLALLQKFLKAKPALVTSKRGPLRNRLGPSPDGWRTRSRRCSSLRGILG